MLYVNQIGDTQYPPPYQLPDVRVSSFRLAVQLDALTGLCNDLLNVGDLADRRFEYRPIFPFVDIEILHYPRMEYALFPPAGFVTQHECCVRVFVMKYVDFGGLLFPDGEVAIFCPILIVDNAWSAFAGREVVGYPKLMGEFSNYSKDNPFVTIKTQVLRELLVDQESSIEPVITVASAPANVAPVKPPAGGWPFGDIADHLGPIERELGRKLLFTPAVVESVQMKQLRDATLPFEACYQAILQSLVILEKSGRFEELPPVRVMLNDYATFDLARRLRLPTGQPLTPMAQYRFECSFSFSDPITVFKNSDDFSLWSLLRWLP